MEEITIKYKDNQSQGGKLEMTGSNISFDKLEIISDNLIFYRKTVETKYRVIKIISICLHKIQFKD